MAEPLMRRAEWVDTARCLAMLGIMWLHSGPPPSWLSAPVGGGICLFLFWQAVSCLPPLGLPLDALAA